MSDVHLDKLPEPGDGEELDMLLDWLRWQRQTFLRKTRDLSDEQMATEPIAGIKLSIHGLIRHMTQMEHGYLTVGLGGGDLEHRYSTDEHPGADYEDVAADRVAADFEILLQEMGRADAAIATIPALAALGAGHGKSLGWTLVKMTQEYAVHNGEAHMIRNALLADD